MKYLFIVLLVLASTTSFSQSRFRGPLPQDGLRVPQVAQTTDYTCGPTAVLALLQYYQRALADTELSLAAEMGTTYELGTNYQEMHQALVRRGFDAVLTVDSDLSALEAELAQGHPAIVNFKSFGVGHYAVAVALDRRHIYFMDPWFAPRPVRMKRAEFARKWFDEHQGVRLKGLMIAIRAVAP